MKSIARDVVLSEKTMDLLRKVVHETRISEGNVDTNSNEAAFTESTEYIARLIKKSSTCIGLPV